MVSTPAVGDLNGDTLIEVVAGSYDGRIYIWQVPGVAHSTAVAWGTFRFDAARAGFMPGQVEAKPMPPLSQFCIPIVLR